MRQRAQRRKTYEALRQTGSQSDPLLRHAGGTGSHWGARAADANTDQQWIYEVNGEIQSFIRCNNLESDVQNGNVTFWISGFSRAGATSNLTAKRLVDPYAPAAESGNKVFAYCNEAPQGAVDTAMKQGSDYNCIHSVINRTDLCPWLRPATPNNTARFSAGVALISAPAGHAFCVRVRWDRL